MQVSTSFLVGLAFGMGLIVSGMADPSKVLGFLDLTGRWDPSLAVVMVAATAVGRLMFSVADKRAKSILGRPMRLPNRRGGVDGRLLGGGLLFGIGWGIAGFCPGPAVVALGSGGGKAALFVAAMLVGMAVFEWLEQRRRHPIDAPRRPAPSRPRAMRVRAGSARAGTRRRDVERPGAPRDGAAVGPTPLLRKTGLWPVAVV